jgi:transcriptional regulator with XRE-family HTH domain
MMNLGQRIRTIRQNRGLSQSKVEELTGIKREYLSKIENYELKNPTYSTIVKICKGIDVSVAELLDPEEFKIPRPVPVINVVSVKEKGKKRLKDEINVGELVSIPIINGKKAASNPATINEKDIQDYVLVHSQCLKHFDESDRYRCIQVGSNDKSMIPMIESGSLVCFDSLQREPKALDGKIVVMKNNDGSCFIRKLKIEKKSLVGIPLNSDEYPPIVVSLGKLNYIIGKVVWFRTLLET